MQISREFTGYLGLSLVAIIGMAMTGDLLSAQTGQISGRVLGPTGQVISLQFNGKVPLNGLLSKRMAHTP